MNKIFAAVAAASMTMSSTAWPETATAQTTVAVPANAKDLKHVKYQSVESIYEFVQNGFTDDASQISFVPVERQLARFQDKNGVDTFMGCKEIDTNRLANTRQHYPKQFMKEMDKASADLHCPRPALI